MNPINKKTEHSYTLKAQQRQAFLEVLNLSARNGKINSAELRGIFQRIGYTISENHFKDICDKCFDFKDEITFEEFMEVFTVKDTPLDLIDIKNAFKLIAGDHDSLIPVELLYEMFRKIGMEKAQVDELVVLLGPYMDPKVSKFNYEMFLSHLS